MKMYDIEIEITSRVIVQIEADSPASARKTAEELCGNGDYSPNVPEIVWSEIVSMWDCEENE
jgi:hypothetical protein